MSKYINMILLSIFGVLSFKYGIGLSLIIPFIVYYGYKYIKNLILIIPSVFLSLYFFKINLYLIYIILFILLIFTLLISKKYKKLILTIYCIVINILILIISKFINNDSSYIILDIISIFISPIIYLFLIFNNNAKNTKIKSISYNEILLAFILTIGSAYYKICQIPISFVLGIYFTMYFSSNRYLIGNIIYSFITSFVLIYFFNINYSFLIIITALIYNIPNIISSIVYILLLIYMLAFSKDLIPINLYYIIGIIAIVFEIVRPININKKEDNKIINNIYEKTFTQIDVDTEGFALFLDKISANISKGDYNEDLGPIILKLSSNICGKCEKKTECLKRNKGRLYYYYKNCIFGNVDDFICEHSDEMKRYGRSLSNNLIDRKEYANELLIPILSGISNILRYYRIDHTVTLELEYDKIFNLKEGIEKYGYSISYFNVLRTIKNDFIIEIGLIGIVYLDEKENIENVCSHYLNVNCSCVLKDTKKNKTYVNIIPKTNYNISYGFGSISKLGNSICGDNYLVKQLSNNKLIAIICDGMGKGLNANIISSRTLNLIDEITNSNISGEASLQILNTLYYIQDYQECYTTLDYIEIDKNSGQMLLYKAGAAFTYIIHQNGEIEKIENDNLPYGLNEIIMASKIQLYDNDLILLASDGIFDNIINIEDFELFIQSIKDYEPQKISYELLNYARHTDLVSKDDMSVIALKIKLI